jgi:hypothetical protein
MKSLGLNAEEVCEIGKWKGVEAFVMLIILAHKNKLGRALSALVHNGTSLIRTRCGARGVSYYPEVY